ncbi:winged helix-turn-helix domain-containing protein [Nocardiopsis sp. NPDC049922]|uniref:GntR family transcriptional regulator n=1 Tax=Nocardiopsis sp. NPDC049922 TaxID=3155157 RepID=UPI0033C02849
MSAEPGNLRPLNPDDPRPLSQQVAEAIRTSIRSGDLEPRTRLPSGPELAKSYGVARMTVQEAIRVLRDEGLVISQQGRGVFVRDWQSKPEGGTPSDLEEVYEQLARIQVDLDNVQEKVRRIMEAS